MESLYLLQDKVVSKSKSGDISGMLAVLLPDVEDDALNWEGGKIGTRLWSMIKAFMKWTYEEHKCESQVRLFYHVAKKVWAAVPLPQYISTGLTTTEIKTHELRDKLLEKFPSDQWKEFGTVHHHCAVGAFQSGTDWDDETKCPGVHITLGNMDKPSFAIHSRCSFRGIIYEIEAEQWLDTVDLSSPELVEGSFPSHWKDSMVERPAISYTTSDWYKRFKQGLFGLGSDDAGVASVGTSIGFHNRGYDNAGYEERLRRWRESYGKTAEDTNTPDIRAIEREDDELTSNIQYEYILRELQDHMPLMRTSTEKVVMRIITDAALDLDDAESLIEAISTVYDGIDSLLSEHVVNMDNLCRVIRAFVSESSYLDQDSVDSTMMATILRDAGGVKDVKAPATAKQKTRKVKGKGKGKKGKASKPVQVEDPCPF